MNSYVEDLFKVMMPINYKGRLITPSGSGYMVGKEYSSTLLGAKALVDKSFKDFGKSFKKKK